MCGESARHHESSDKYRSWEGRSWDRVEKLQVFSGGGKTRTPATLQQGGTGGNQRELRYN